MEEKINYEKKVLKKLMKAHFNCKIFIESAFLNTMISRKLLIALCVSNFSKHFLLFFIFKIILQLSNLNVEQHRTSFHQKAIKTFVLLQTFEALYD